MVKKVLVILGLGAALCSCASKPDAYQKIDAEVRKGSYETAVAEIEKAQAGKKPLYDPKKNSISLLLDKGMLEHYAGKYEDSSQDLGEAKQAIEDAATKSVSEDIASYIANDNTKEYAGEDYEDIYTSLFNALNYYRRGDLEGAQNDARRIIEDLKVLPDKYAAGEGKIKEWVKTKLDNHKFPDSTPITFTNSALAQYIAGILFRGDPSGSAADRICILDLNKAYRDAPAIYKTPLPRSLRIPLDNDGQDENGEPILPEELQVPAGKARLNIIGFAGLSPIKVEKSVPFSFPGLPQGRLLLPALIPRRSEISRIEAVLEGAGTVELALLEDMEAVMMETFKAKYSLIYLKTLVRTATKYLTADVAGASAGLAVASAQKDEQDEKEKKRQAALGLLAGILVAQTGKMIADASERADVRMGRYFPGKAYVGGITLEPGFYAVTVNYYGTDGVVASYKQDNVLVSAGKPNVIETFCLK